MTRRGWLVVVLGGVVLAASALVLATRVRSSDQAIADAAAPARTVLTERVERRVLGSDVVVRGTIAAAHAVPVRAGASPGRDPIVSATPVPAGAEVPEGGAVLEVAGRPVIVLMGAVPSYRDLRLGDAGPDVRQLEAALRRVGLQVGRDDGVFDEALARAVGSLWRNAGYEPALYAPDAGDGSLDPSPAWPMVPKHEVAFTPAAPARVGLLAATVGATVGDEPALVLAAGPLQVVVVTDRARAAELPVGRTVEVLDLPDGRAGSTGTVVAVGAPTVDADTGRETIEVRIDPREPLPVELLGAEVRITASGPAALEPSLVVPVAALVATADGGEAVVVLDDRDEERRVPVRTREASGGFVAVVPLDPDGLEEGSRVVVGR